MIRCPSCHINIRIADPAALKGKLRCPGCAHSDLLSGFPKAEFKKFACPDCQGVIAFDPLSKGLKTCTHCKKQNEISRFKEVKPASKKDDDTDPTILKFGKKSVGGHNPGKLALQQGDVSQKTIALAPGNNKIGRRSASSSCEIQLDTVDQYVSRAHVCITVKQRPDGGYVHHLHDLESKNGTYHNRERLVQGEVIVLSNNDLIRIGSLIYKFIQE